MKNLPIRASIEHPSRCAGTYLLTDAFKTPPPCRIKNLECYVAIYKKKSKSHDSSDPPPAALGYRMPAEWEPHAATWLAWPHYHGDWPGKFEPIPWVYAEIIRNLAKHERVELIVNNAAAAQTGAQEFSSEPTPSRLTSASTAGPRIASGCATRDASFSRRRRASPGRHSRERLSAACKRVPLASIPL